MLRIRSREGTSDISMRHRVIQLTALERAARPRTLYRYTAPRTANMASAISRTQIIASRSFMGVIILALTIFYPVGAYASSEQTAPAETPATTNITTSTEPPASPSSDPIGPEVASSAPSSSVPIQATQPSAPAAQQQTSTTPATPAPQPKPEKPKYKYDEATGLWTNGTYAWDPNTGQTKPLNSPDYSFNPETNKWETKDWRFDPTEGKYVPNTVRLAPNSSGDGVKTGSESSNYFDLYYNAGISNNVYSSALSGNAAVFGNTLGGNALSGNALAIANIINMINSSLGLSGGSSVASFSSDIYGDVVGDLYVDPSALASIQPASGVEGLDPNLKVNINTSSSVDNNISLAAKSGDASVSGNTKGGNAISGSADAVANIVNMLNSAISSGSSFIGLLNIYGNLNGDILLPTGILNQLLASNNGCISACSGNSDLNVNLNDNQLITNNLNTTAKSGTATVAKNTSAGSATSGNGQTNVTILNLTGRNVVAANSLLVFVNVLGQWVGVIMDAPAGSTSAALGTGVTQDNSNALVGNSDISASTNAKINNNVDVNARSGNADVSRNTEAGNARSGDASASVNLANITNSNFSLANWFGILFINVFGTWNGSFGVDTAAGNKPRVGVPSAMDSGNVAPKVFQFVPSSSGGGMTLSSVDLNDTANVRAVADAMESAQGELIKQQTGGSSGPGVSESNIEPSKTTANNKNADFTLPMLGFAIGGSLIGGERLVSRRQRRK